MEYLWIIVILLSAVWTLILTAPIHCRGSIGEQVTQCYISPKWYSEEAIYVLDGLEVSTFSENVHFWVYFGAILQRQTQTYQGRNNPEPFHQHPDCRLPRNMRLMLKWQCTSGSQQYSMTFQLCKAGKVKIETSEGRFVWKWFFIPICSVTLSL